jgi:PKD repeat protein
MLRFCFVFIAFLLVPVPASAQNLTLTGGSITLWGTHTYADVTITGGTLNVASYTGSGTTGTLHLIVSGTFTLGSGGTVNGNGRGYQGQTNANGAGPGGGQGGSCCWDAGGGGGYGAAGGTGVRDDNSTPEGAGGGAYGSSTSLAIQMGSAGGAAGQLDGDFGGQGGNGGAAFWVTAPTIIIDGVITMNGNNGGNFNNDAAGGGAGGGILLDGTTVQIGGGAVLRANGGAGADVDDNGGGGAGGRIKDFHGSGTPSAGTQQVLGGNGPGNATNGGTGTVQTIQTNLPPNAVAGGPYSGVEGGTVPLGGGGSNDPDGTIALYEWDCTDDGTYDTSQAGAGGTCAYAQDGTFTARLRVTDNGGLTDTDTATVTIANVAPTASAGAPHYFAPEGSPVAFTGSVTDVGVQDTHTATWTFGDGTIGSGFNPSHAYADDGTYTATITVTDDAGDSDTDTSAVFIANVAPTITSTPGTAASQGIPYSYAAAVTDPGTADTHTWSLAVSPGTMTVGTAGLVEWTPTFADTGTATVVLTVTDDDGGTDTQTWTIVVGFTDDDGDGMADGWESANGLDPTDPLDGTGDPDGDGVSNLAEFLGGTDPNVFDGPTAPVLIAPIGGVEVVDARPLLVVGAATDPQGDPLTYDIEVYADAALTALLTTILDLPPDDATGLGWIVDVNLPENAEAHWRARAADPYAAGPWASSESFFVNELEEPPEVPVPIFPIDGERVGTTQPTPQWSNVVDPDGDDVVYEVRIRDESGALLAEGTVDPGGAREEWTVDVVLDEDAFYDWDVRAVDDTGLASDWSAPEAFFVTADEGAPGDVHFLSPRDGDSVGEVAPDLVSTETTDPEGDAVTYVFGLDTAADFGSADFIEGVVAHSGTGSSTWDLGAEAIVLTANTTWHARVRAEDSTGLGSVGGWDIISFFVAGDDDPPPVPELISPEDGATLDATTATLEIGTVEDPDGDTVTYTIRVSSDAAGDDVLATATGLVPGGAAEDVTVTWVPSISLRDRVYWTARAEAAGAASDWAEPHLLILGITDPPPDVVPDGCEQCAATVAGGDRAAGFLALAALLGCRRRRPSRGSGVTATVG